MNSNRRFSWLVFGAAGALFLGACVAPDGDEEELGGANDVTIDGAQEPTAGDISVKLSVDKTSVGASEAVVVTITLTNNASHPVKLLGWYAPSEELEEDLFSVTLGGAPVEFLGPHYKRPAPTETDFVSLGRGKTLTRVVDITNFYDLSKSADYEVSYAASVRSPNAKEPVEVSSNAVKMWIEGRASAFAAPQFYKAPGPANAASSSFSKCTVTQQADIVSARNAASAMTNDAYAYLGGASPGTPRVTTWFGAYDATRWNTTKSHYTAIKGTFDSAAMNFDCGCKKTYYAYVYPNQPYNIYLCKAFWAAPMTGTDSKGGTLIHETSHFTAVAGTDDWVYGQSGAKSLAISDPAKAIDNADSHEYFAENTPSLQ